jgi:hypothetical protein
VWFSSEEDLDFELEGTKIEFVFKHKINIYFYFFLKIYIIIKILVKKIHKEKVSKGQLPPAALSESASDFLEPSLN